MWARILKIRFFASILAAVLLSFSVETVSAHGSLSIEEDQCTLRIGRHIMHFAGFQPYGKNQIERFNEFCEDIPAIGQTFVVLDLVDHELRHLPIAVKVLKDLGRDKDENAPVVFEYAGQSHPNGTFNYKHTFIEAGSYVGVITAGTGSDLMTARFPFSVGPKPDSGIWLYIFYAVLVLLGTGGLIIYGLGRHEKALGSGSR